MKRRRRTIPTHDRILHDAVHHAISGVNVAVVCQSYPLALQMVREATHLMDTLYRDFGSPLGVALFFGGGARSVTRFERKYGCEFEHVMAGPDSWRR